MNFVNRHTPSLYIINLLQIGKPILGLIVNEQCEQDKELWYMCFIYF